MTNRHNPIEPSTSFRKVFAIYINTSRKRVVITIFTGALVFLALTSFFMIWYSYRYNSFYNYINQNHDWLDDGKISINSADYLYGEFYIESDYLNKGIAEVTTKLEQLMPNVQSSYTGALRINLYRNTSEYESVAYYLHTLDSNATHIVESNLVKGRLPENYTELLYYRTNSTSTIKINDTLPLSGENYEFNGEAVLVNYTIVGIVEDLNRLFYKEGISTDVLKTGYFDNYRSYDNNDEQFITSTNLFYNFINTVKNFSGTFHADIDINYQFTIEHIKNKKTYIQNIKDFLSTSPTFGHMPSFYVSFCFDLLEALDIFKRNWQMLTISVFASSLPMVFLFGVISIETFNIGTHEQETKYRLIKTHGLENKVLAKIVLFENLITIGSSFLIGSSLGLLLGFFIFLGLKIPKEVSYFAALAQPIIMISLLSLFIGFTLGKFLFDLIQTRRASITTAAQYKKKRKKFFRRVISIPEIVTFVPGAILTAIGIILIMVVSYQIYPYKPSSFSQMLILFWFLASIGILLLLISIFLVLTRLVTLIWRLIGHLTWKTTKSYFTLALKHLSIYGKNYQRTVMAIFILGLGIIPGIIMNKSIASHSYIEANLSVGCADIAVEGWNVNNNKWMDNISRIEGVEKVTEVNIIKMQIYKYDLFDYHEYEIRFNVIHNVTEYLNIVNLTEVLQDGYTKNDIAQLDTNLTYLMSRKYAQENNYDKGAIFRTTLITDEQYEPLSMTYVNDFSYYPLLTRLDIKIANEYYFEEKTKFDMIMNKATSQMILNKSDNQITTNGYLLIKTESNANTTKIKKEIFTKFSYKAYTPEDKEQIILENINGFANTFLLVSTIVSTLAIFLFGSVNAINIYKQRLRIIESETQIGAKRRLIWGNFTIELVLVVLFPLIVSMGIAIPIINNFSSFILNIAEVYKKFVPWHPWWLIISLAIVVMIVLFIGWFTRLIPLVKSYRPIKQE
ncbi:MAG: hypothetical protein HZR80_08910 [Candidatus Heimdallarchaeota archaeon]